MNAKKNINNAANNNHFSSAVNDSFSCKKIRSGKYEYRGWIIICIGYYEPEQCVVWEAHDPKTGCADFHGFSKKEIKRLIDEDLSKISPNTDI